MTTRVASDNRFPLVRVLEDPDAPPTPPAGEVHLRVDEATKLLYQVDDAGLITFLGSTAYADILDIPTAETDGALVLAPDGAGGVEFRPEGTGQAASVQFVIDGGGATITTGVKGYLRVPFAATIVAARLLADQSGSIVVDVWEDTYANFPPVDADSITASAPLTISGAVKSEDATLTGWTTSLVVGSILGFNVDSVTTLTRVTVELDLVRA